jgi:hypothetical protein
MIRKGQVEGFAKDDILAPLQFMSQLFGIAG